MSMPLRWIVDAPYLCPWGRLCVLPQMIVRGHCDHCCICALGGHYGTPMSFFGIYCEHTHIFWMKQSNWWIDKWTSKKQLPWEEDPWVVLQITRLNLAFQLCFVFVSILVSWWPLAASSLQPNCYYYKIAEVFYLETDSIICGTHIQKKYNLHGNLNTSFSCLFVNKNSYYLVNTYVPGTVWMLYKYYPM